ncbi:MAG: hypothetical protein K2P75_09735 [Sphingobacteriaceae bacterium]|nr:hypothetical protein [Sphingobacteriaceae bacterium]
MKILLTGGKSAVALKLLKAFTKYKVVLADYGDVPLFVSKDYQLISLGSKNEDVLAHTLLNNCLNEGVDAILPIYTFEIEALVKAKILFSEFNIEVLLPEDTATYSNGSKTNNWVVFKSGELVYTTTLDEEINALATKEKLSGAFYINTDKKLKLITV